MECTQRLECTQNLYETRTERVCPEQIGFLGICGVKHPVKKGPNKIGRDPQTCSIVLNLNSISRQHAVINILNQKDFMLMDLDSANKTKLMDKTLPPYIPHPLKNGDMVQFGDIFGVFRLLEEDDYLPMTQALDIPETPVSTRHVSKFNKMPNTTVPESPDVSDREDSFIAPSQPKGEKCFRSSNNHFIKPSSNTISIKPIGSDKIDNVYWSSSKRSVSLNTELNESYDKSDKNTNVSIHEMETQNPFSNVIPVGEKHDNIHELETQPPLSAKQSLEKENNLSSIHDMETQVPYLKNKPKENSIHEMETQVPYLKNKPNENSIHEMETQAITSNQANDSIDSIYTAETQVSYSPSIHSLATQLPEVCKINNQQEMQINLFTTFKDSDDDIFSADTQPFIELGENLERQTEAITSLNDSQVQGCDKVKLNTSDDEIVLEELDQENLEDDLNSQPIIPVDFLKKNDENAKSELLCKNKMSGEDNWPDKIVNTEKKSLEIHSDSSTDCEDVILSGQKTKDQDDDLTDCEDIAEEKQKEVPDLKCGISRVPNVGFEDMLTQRIDIEDLPTQVITLDEDKINNDTNLEKDMLFEDLPTQVIHDENAIKAANISSNTKTTDLESTFKIPFISPIKLKRKDMKLIMTNDKVISDKVPTVTASSKNIDDDNYYAATQDILEDLCSQQIISSKGSRTNLESDDELVPCSVEDYKTGDRFPHIEYNASPTKTVKSSDSTDDDDKVANFVSNLTSQQIREVVGVEPPVDRLKKEPSDPSDVEVTPKKVKPIKFMDIDFPNSQEIKSVVSQHSKTLVTESSSDSETENDSQEQCTPILFKKKKKSKKDAKIDLTKKFDVEALPTRVLTRVRKPPSKLLNDVVEAKTYNILKPKFMIEQEEEIDKDIITENISRLKSKSEKSKLKDKKPKSESLKDAKCIEKENEKQTVKVVNQNEKPNIEKSESIKDAKCIEKENEKQTVKVANQNEKPNIEKSESIKDAKCIEKENEKLTVKVTNKNENPKIDKSGSLQDAKSIEKENKKLTVKVTNKNENPKIDKSESLQDAKSIEKENKKLTVKVTKNNENPIIGKSKSLQDAKCIEKGNENLAVKVTNKNENPKIDKAKNSNKGHKTNLKVENKLSDIEIITIEESDSTKKRGSRQKNNDDKSMTKARLSDKEMDGNSSKNTSTDTNTSIKSTRSTRSRRMVDAVKTDSQVEENSQKTRKERSTRQKQTIKPIEIDLTEEVTDVRRSKRQRTSKEKKEEEVTKVKSILKKDKPVKHEQSTVYSVSSGSGTESPVNLKRTATSELGPPSPKRTKSNMANESNNNMSLRATPARMNRTQYVLFTAFPSEEVRAKLEKLGAVIVTEVSACTMVLTLQIKRTLKLLCAVGLGRPIVGPAWVQACADSNIIVDPWLYVLKDEVAEKRFQFNLERVLQSKRNFLKGYNVTATPNVLPNPAEMKLIVECSGGVWKEGGPQWVCVTCSADKALWPLLKQKGATIVTSEFILGGVLRQRVDIAGTKLL